MQTMVRDLLLQLSAYFPDTPFRAQYWTGEIEQFGVGAPLFTLRAHNLDAVKRVLRDGSLGLGEEIMAGHIEIEGDAQEFLKFHAAPIFDYRTLSLGQKVRYALALLLTRDTITGAKQNVARHYDLGNDFYRLWLDETMTYTCAYFQSPHDTLADAQRNKHEHICRKLRLEPGQTLVDIGCGWGAMMFYAAEHFGVNCVGCTISERQYEYVQEQIAARGLHGRVSVRLKDYRELEGRFDRFVSIGMFEQVGQRFIPTYFEHAKRMLKPQGVGVLHTIGSLKMHSLDPWINKYIFPGGYVPTLGEIVSPMNERDLNVYDVEDLRLHYFHTLDAWLRNFTQHIPTVEKMYGREFVRMWSLYLNMAAAVFRYGGFRLYQLTFTNGLDNAMPRTREYLHNQSASAYFALPTRNGAFEEVARS